jgi:hypothetical protein
MKSVAANEFFSIAKKTNHLFKTFIYYFYLKLYSLS